MGALVVELAGARDVVTGAAVAVVGAAEEGEVELEP